MSIFTDLEKDAASVDGFVSENGLIPTRRNGPKPSYQYLVDGWNAEIAAAILEMNKSRGFRVVGTFTDGFTYELFNDVGIDADGNSWIYVGAGAPNKVVSAGTVPSVGAGYEKVTFNAASGVTNANGGSVQDFIDNLSGSEVLDSRGTNVQDYIDGNLTPFKTVADMKAAAYLSALPEFTRVEWQGYYAQSDGGGNWGVLRFGTHTEDGGSVFSIDANTYIEANLAGHNTTPVKWGARGNNTGDDRDYFYNALNNSNSVDVFDGVYTVGGSKLGEFQKPINVIGQGPDVIIKMLESNVDKTAFRVGAVGSAYYRARAVTKFQNLVFTINDGQPAPWSYTGIDLQAVFPVNLKDLVFLSMGPSALKIRDCFYGYTEGVVLVNSGMDLFEVNTINFTGFESRPEQASTDPTEGALLFGNVGEYPIKMEDSDLVSFQGVIEGWKVPVMSMIRCDDTVFNNTWFESLQSDSHVIKMEQAQNLEFNSCQLDFAFPYSDCFILVDNSTPNNDRRKKQTTIVRISGGNLLLRSNGFGQRNEFVKVVNDSDKVSVLIDGTEFRGGTLFADKEVDFDIKSIRLTNPALKLFYSLPNAVFNKGDNSWLRDGSASTDWDFSTGAKVSQIGGSGLSISLTSVPGEFMTGSQGVKVSGILSGPTVWQIGRSASGQLPPVSVEGQTFLFFARVKSSQAVKVFIEVNSGFSDYGGDKGFEINADKWIDIVFQTQEDSTWAQGKNFAPTLKFKIENESGSDADFYIDRIDYSLVNGDVII